MVGRACDSVGNCPYAEAQARGSGVYGEASTGTGVFGFSPNGGGVNGRSTSSIGVTGSSGSYIGVLGIGGLYAGIFEGDLHYTGTLTGPSDIRLKRNVEPLTYGLDEVRALKPVSYIMKDDAQSKIRLGLIAQDVEPIIPELIQLNKTNDTYSLNYLDLIPVLTRAIQEQQAQIEALKGGASLASSPSADASEDAPAPQVTVIRESGAGSPLNGWALPGAVAMFAFAVAAHAAVSLRRRQVVCNGASEYPRLETTRPKQPLRYPDTPYSVTGGRAGGG